MPCRVQHRIQVAVVGVVVIADVARKPRSIKRTGYEHTTAAATGIAGASADAGLHLVHAAQQLLRVQPGTRPARCWRRLRAAGRVLVVLPGKPEILRDEGRCKLRDADFRWGCGRSGSAKPGFYPWCYLHHRVQRTLSGATSAAAGPAAHRTPKYTTAAAISPSNSGTGWLTCGRAGRPVQNAHPQASSTANAALAATTCRPARPAWLAQWLPHSAQPDQQPQRVDQSPRPIDRASPRGRWSGTSTALRIWVMTNTTMAILTGVHILAGIARRPSTLMATRPRSRPIASQRHGQSAPHRSPCQFAMQEQGGHQGLAKVSNATVPGHGQQHHDAQTPSPTCPKYFCASPPLWRQ